MNKLEKALSGLLNQSELVSCLASVLGHASKKGSISYPEVCEIAGNHAEDVLLLGDEWRLLLPVRTLKSAAWEDRLLLCEPGESYEVPNIVRSLVEMASTTGCWDPDHAITKLFKEMGEPSWERMSELIERLEAQAEGHRIAAIHIKRACSELGLGDGVDTLIATLKASGIMSPKLSSLADVVREGSPLYELNPSLFVGREPENDHKDNPNCDSPA
jgi:hypothetical protein